jgi:hypothetical protein
MRSMVEGVQHFSADHAPSVAAARRHLPRYRRGGTWAHLPLPGICGPFVPVPETSRILA